MEYTKKWRTITKGLNKGWKSMSLSDYFRIIHPRYVKFTITPDSSVRNNLTESIAIALSDFYSPPIERLIRDGFKLRYYTMPNATFEIDFSSNNITFNICMPEEKSEIIQARLEACWGKVAIKKSYELIENWDIDKCEIYQLRYINNPIYSLKTDARDNTPLPEVLQGSRFLKEGDKAKVLAHFVPYSRKAWFTEYLKGLQKIKQGKDIRREGRFQNILNFFADLIYELSTIFNEPFGKGCKSKSAIALEEDKVRAKFLLDDMSRSTQNKEVKSVLLTGLFVIAQGKNSSRSASLCRSIGGGYIGLKEDNELTLSAVKSKAKKQLILSAVSTKETPSNLAYEKFSSAEVGKLIQLPGAELQEEYPQIDNIAVREVDVPKEMRNGRIPLGTLSLKGATRYTYWNESFNAFSKPKIIIGPSGSGKSTYLEKYCADCANAGIGNIIFDYIMNCGMSKNVINKIKDKSKVVIYDLSDIDNLPSLDFCEMKIKEDDPKSRFKIAFRIKSAMTGLIESIQTASTSPLASRMLRYFTAACMLVFIHENENLYSVMQVLQDHNVRWQYIDRAVDSGLFEMDSIEINDLIALDEVDKDGNATGTKISKVEGIIDRLSMLTDGLHTRFMLTSKKKIDFVELMEQGKTVIFQMPQEEFTSNEEKDIIVCSLLTKIWLAQMIRGAMHDKPRMCNIVIDEIHQVKGAAKSISTFITEVRKFGCSFVFAAQYLEQFGILQSALAGTGTSYMLLTGCDKNILKSLQEEMKPYTLAEALKLPKFSSLNIINNENETAAFVSKL